MSAIGTLFREALKSLRAGNIPDLGPPSDISHCGCPLAEGCWGSGGWHFARWTIAAWYDREKREFAAKRPEMSVAGLRAAWAAWLMWEEDAGRFDEQGVHVNWVPDMGQPYAFEPCLSYRAKVREGMAGDQAEKQVERKKRYDRNN